MIITTITIIMIIIVITVIIMIVIIIIIIITIYLVILRRFHLNISVVSLHCNLIENEKNSTSEQWQTTMLSQ